MKVTANRAQLLSLVRSVCKAVPSASPVEILMGILVEADADSNTITFTGTNYEAAIQCKMDTFVDVSGSMVINAKLFRALLELFGVDEVTISLGRNGTVCLLTGGSAYYEIAVLPAKNYPKVDIPRPEGTVKVSNLSVLAKNTVFAAGKSDDKPILTGVRLDIYSDSVRACGCDGSRLMEKTLQTETGGKLRLVVPARAFNLLAGMVKDNEVLDVGVAGAHAVFMKEGFVFSVKHIPGEYINVDEMLTAITPEYSAVVDAKALYQAINYADAVANGESRSKISFHGKTLTVTMSCDNGSSCTTVEAEVKTETPESGFHYNTGYLLESLRRLSGKVELQLSSIGMLTIKTESDLCFLMPLRASQVKAKSKSKKAPKTVEKKEAA